MQGESTGVQRTDLDGSIQDEFTKIPENRSQTVLCSGVRFGTQKKPGNEGFNSLGSRDTLARDSHVPLLSDKVRSSSTINCEERIIPRFSAKKPSNTVTQTMSSPGSQPSRIVPVFKARKDSTQTKGLGNQLQKGSGKERQKQLSISHGVSIDCLVIQSGGFSPLNIHKLYSTDMFSLGPRKVECSIQDLRDDGTSTG